MQNHPAEISLATLPVELVFLIVEATEDHLCYQRLAQVAKWFHMLLTTNQANRLWYVALQRDLPNRIISGDTDDYRSEYKRLFLERLRKLSPLHKRLYHWVRSDNLAAIKAETKINYHYLSADVDEHGNPVIASHDFRDIYDEWLVSPLQLACKYNRVNILKWIYDKTIQTIPQEDLAAVKIMQLEIAVLCGMKTVVSQCVTPDLSQSCLQNLCESAVIYGHIDIVCFLLSKLTKESRLICNKFLHTAARKGNFALIGMLLPFCNIDAVEEVSGETALSLAASEGHDLIVKALIEAKATINVMSKIGATPLYLAARCGHVTVVELLLKAGANINQHCGFMTPIDAAVMSGQWAVVPILLDKGAQLSPPCANILVLASIKFGMLSLLSLVISTFTRRTDVLFIQAIECQQRDILVYLLKQNYDKRPDYNHETVLLAAQRNSDPYYQNTLCLWPLKRLYQGKPMRDLVIALIDYGQKPTSFTLLKSYFFTTPQAMLIKAIRTQVSDHDSPEDQVVLKNLLNMYKADIQVDKFTFINNHIIGDKDQMAGMLRP